MINMNSSLLLNKNTNNRIIPLRTHTIESYYIPSLSVIADLNEDLRKAQLEFYNASKTGVVYEANVLKTVTAKIMGIIDAILKAIDVARKFITNTINSFIVKTKSKQAVRDLHELYNLIDDYYTHNMYFTMSTYSNSLTHTLIDARIPKPDAEIMNAGIDRIIDSMNYHLKHSVTYDMAKIKDEMESQKERLIQNRVSLRKELIGVKAINVAELGDQTIFRQQLIDYYIGAKTDRLINHSVAIHAVDNLNNVTNGYTNIISDLSSSMKNIDQFYSTLKKRVDNFKKQANDILQNPEKFVTGDDEYKTNEVENCIVLVAQTAVMISNTLNAIMNDHITAFTVKLECLNIMRSQDAEIVNRVTAIIKKTNGVKESHIHTEKDTELLDEMDESLMQFCEGCFSLKEAQANIELNQKIYPGILQEADEESTNFVENIIGRIVDMFKKFLQTLNVVVGKDKEWFDKNEETIKSGDFKFPSDGDIPDWVNYKIDRLTKSFGLPTFDMNNSQLMGDLESDETYGKFIYSKIGGSESEITTDEAKNGNFTMKCRALYGDGKEEKVKLADLLSKKNDFFDYCKNYLAGEDGGIYKSIQADTKTLDQSKKTVMRDLKNNSKVSSNGENTAETKTTTTTTSTTSDASTTAAKPSGEKAATNESSSLGFDINLAQILGLSEGTFIFSEVTLPKESENVDKNGEESKSQEKILKEKATRFFTMTGNALGAKMTSSMKAYNQYKALFKWALKKSDEPATEDKNEVSTTTEETSTDDGESIMQKASK